MAQTVKIFFDGEEKECLVQTDDNGEIVCTARDGQFVKFPADSDLDAEVAKHNADESNVAVPVSGEEVEAKKAELHDWLDDDAKAARGLVPENAPAADNEPHPERGGAGSEAEARQSDTA